MNSIYDSFAILGGMLPSLILLGVQLWLSVLVQTRLSRRAGSRMLIGTMLAGAGAIASNLVPYLFGYDMDNLSTILIGIHLESLIGQIFFLSGLYVLIKEKGERRQDDDVLDGDFRGSGN